MAVNAISQAPGGCGCPPCNITVSTAGCQSDYGFGVLSGVLVVAKRGGVTVASGTTSGGHVTINIGGIAPVDLILSKARFTTITASGLSLACGTSLGYTLTPATGYHCINSTNCSDPVADTLFATFSVHGPETFTHSGHSWVASFTASGHAYVMTIYEPGFGGGSSMTTTRDGVALVGITWQATSCPPSFAGSIFIPTSSPASTEVGGGPVTE
jgi:hypothetical protein